MRSLSEIKKNNEDAALDASYDENRPILERARIWLETEDTNFGHAIELIDGLVTRFSALEENAMRSAGNMVWWYENQINPIRKALGLTEMDYILDAVLALKARNEELEDRLADDLEARNAADSD